MGAIFWLAVTLALGIITLTALLNSLTFPRLRAVSLEVEFPSLSVLIPARDEAAVIGQTVQRLLTQAYPADYEILVLDDNSQDGTAEIARRAAGDDARLRVLDGDPLPPGWLGKNWACHQLAQQARGDVLLFTDADVIWAPGALAAVAGLMQRSRRDMLTVWPTQRTESWPERLTVPLMALVVLGYLPEIMVRFSPWTAFAAANGQCIALRHPAYDVVGGHAAVRGAIVEDIMLARGIKASGHKLIMADGGGLVGCRMYTDWPSARDGYAKNIIAGHGGPLMLAFSTLFHWAVFLGPWLWLIFGALLPLGPFWPFWPLALMALGVGVRALTAAVTRQRAGDALLMPISVLLMTLIAWRAFRWHFGASGPQWKGRALR